MSGKSRVDGPSQRAAKCGWKMSTAAIRVLLADGRKLFREALALLLEKHSDIRVIAEAPSEGKAKELMVETEDGLLYRAVLEVRTQGTCIEGTSLCLRTLLVIQRLPQSDCLSSGVLAPLEREQLA